MVQGEKFLGIGLSLGAFGLAAAIALGTVLPAGELAAAPGDGGAAVQPTFSLSCRKAEHKPGFDLLNEAGQPLATPSADGAIDCQLQRGSW